LTPVPTAELLGLAKIVGSVVTISVPLIIAAVKVLPNRIVALTADREQRDSESRRQRDELRSLLDRAKRERDQAVQEKEAAEDELEHTKNELTRVRDEFVFFSAGCVAKGRPCSQDKPLITIHPYVRPAPPPKPPDASHD
jgi:hypothetical protein